jgi:hypothetical protein
MKMLNITALQYKHAYAKGSHINSPFQFWTRGTHVVDGKKQDTLQTLGVQKTTLSAA